MYHLNLNTIINFKIFTWLNSDVFLGNDLTINWTLKTEFKMEYS